MEPFTSSAPVPQTPDWVKDAVFYHIFPDRFALSTRLLKPGNLESWTSMPTPDGYKGGDLYGVAENIDYLAKLGITAIYFNPIFQSACNHRYHTHDYYQVDPILGGNQALRELLDIAHAQGIKVILDGVFNHASRGFYYFNQALEVGPASPYLDWFNFQHFPLNAYGPGHPQYDCWWNLPALPKFNTKTPAVREYLWNVGKYWLEFGIDGWRLDVPNEIDDDSFWQEFRRRVKGVDPDAYIVGEIWGNASRWLQGDQFDSVMNYLFTRACLAFFISDIAEPLTKVGYYPIPEYDAPQFAQALTELLNLYPPSITQAQLNLLDSHDTARFLSIAKGDLSALQLATLFQMTFPGVPCIYYGDEIGMLGGLDPECRRSFPWIEDAWNKELLTFFKGVIALRHAYPVLRRGNFQVLEAREHLLVYTRQLDNQIMIIALNTGKKPLILDCDLPANAGKNFTYSAIFVLGEDERADQIELVHAISHNGRLQGPLIPARGGVVFKKGSLVDLQV